MDEEDPMNRLGICLSLTAVLALALAAAPEAKGQKKKAVAGKAHSMTGCLQKGEGNMFTLTNVEGSGPKTVEIVGMSSGVNLSPHVGHKIEVTGTTVSPKAAAKAEGAKGKEKKEERGEHHMHVQSMKMIAASCP
jgi:hypothetical protein